MSKVAKKILINPLHYPCSYGFVPSPRWDPHRDGQGGLSLLLAGPDEKQKYYVVKWAQVCHPIDQGVVGIIASRAINVALFLKWV